MARTRSRQIVCCFGRAILIVPLVIASAARCGWCAMVPTLETLARAHFSNLSMAERSLLRFAGSYRSAPAEFAAAGPSANPDDPTNDPVHADLWGKGREVRAALIEWLCVNESANRLVPRGIRLLGARITGQLNLSDSKVPFPLVLRNCSIADRMTFGSAVFPRLALDGSYTGEIDGHGIVVHGDLDLNFLQASGEVWFPNSSIDGKLYAAGARFKRSTVEPQSSPVSGPVKGTALDLSSSTIRGFELLGRGLEVDGALVLGGSSVGEVFLGGGTFNNPKKIAILANSIRVDQAVFLGSSPSHTRGFASMGSSNSWESTWQVVFLCKMQHF
jgi:hypothetical protein